MCGRFGHKPHVCPVLPLDPDFPVDLGKHGGAAPVMGSSNPSRCALRQPVKVATRHKETVARTSQLIEKIHSLDKYFPQGKK